MDATQTPSFHFESPQLTKDIEYPPNLQDMALSTTKYAVYRYYDPTDLGDAMALQVYGSHKDAQMGMYAYAKTELEKHPEWSKKSEKFPPDGIEVYTDDKTLRLKFETIKVIEHEDGQLTKLHNRAGSADTERSSTIAGDDESMLDILDTSMSNDDADTSSLASSKPQINPAPVRHAMAIDTTNDGTRQYGLYVCPDPSQPKAAYLVTSSPSLGEIESYAKVTAAALLKKLNEGKVKLVATCTLHEKGINILRGKRVVLRYEIVEGCAVNGMFVNEADWMAGVRKPELVAYEEDVVGKVPRMVTLTSVNASVKTIANKSKATLKLKGKALQGAATASKPKTPARKRKAKVAAAPVQPTPAPGKINPPNVYCVCRMPDDGQELIACESGDDDCAYNGWFHMACQNMTAVPEGDWWCPLCRQGQNIIDGDDTAMAGI